MMKKFVVLLCLTFLLFIPDYAFASFSKEQSIEEKVIYLKSEITETNKIIDRAVNGETDVKNIYFDVLPSIQKLSSIPISNLFNKEEFEVFLTTQKLKQTQSSEGVITTEYVTNAVVTYQDKSSGNIVDPSSTVRGVVSIRWQEKFENSKMYFKLYSTSGSWTLQDSTFNLSNRKVTYGQVGLEACIYNDCNSTSNLTSNSFTKYAPSSWRWLSKNTNASSLSSTTSVNVNRGTSTFVFRIQVIKHGLGI
ncbi:hypothetical protein NST02_03145 [Robertmurraya sp. FSL W8-0741]|uniref:hypothetical protein n=1 Tax=Robertmurraya sp. FSL W8-0741 TaxID=2954629 RepID=UPI0030F73434